MHYSNWTIHMWRMNNREIWPRLKYIPGVYNHRCQTWLYSDFLFLIGCAKYVFHTIHHKTTVFEDCFSHFVVEGGHFDKRWLVILTLPAVWISEGSFEEYYNQIVDWKGEHLRASAWYQVIHIFLWRIAMWHSRPKCDCNAVTFCSMTWVSLKVASVLTGSLFMAWVLYNVCSRPAVIMIVGVNGGGKTTTIGKFKYWTYFSVLLVLRFMCMMQEASVKFLHLLFLGQSCKLDLLWSSKFPSLQMINSCCRKVSS